MWQYLKRLGGFIHHHFRLWLDTESYDTDSEYIRARISETDWEDRGTIRHLQLLRAYISGASLTASTARVTPSLIRQYPEEYEALRIEHHFSEVPDDPGEYKAALQQVLREENRVETAGDKNREEEKRVQEELLTRTEQRSKANWLKAGGRE